MKKICLILFSAMFMFLGNTAVLAVGLPETAAIIGLELDAQLAERLGEEAPVRGQTIIMTVPADLNNLEVTNPLSRQLAEDLASWFVKAGYSLQEIRKGRDVIFMPQAETMLTRKTDQLGERRVQSVLIMAGTYVKTRAHMRFNLRLLHAGTNEVLAMTSRSLSLAPEIVDLLMDDDSS
ncbi:MAG: FlgO family outer membrane protein, partial [Planctomycetes bacterium]|nr:FlgO family outer membrane protein [Planctomycetota bacterium]